MNLFTHTRWRVVIAAVGVVALASVSAFTVGRTLSDNESALAGPGDGPPPPVADPPTPPGPGESIPTRPPGAVGCVGCDLGPGPEVTPDPGATPDTSKSWWFVPYYNEDRAKPAETLTINGITIGPGVERTGGPCTGSGRPAPLSEARGTPVEINLANLPQGVKLLNASEPSSSFAAVFCDGVAAIAAADLVFPVGHGLVPRGGSVLVVRWLGDPRESIEIPAHRWSAGTVAGSPAAIARPILPKEGLGGSAVFIFDGRVVTKVQADGIPLELLLAIAEEVLR